MTTYILRTGSEVPVPSAPLVAQLQAGGGPFGHRWSVRGTTAEPPVIVRPDRIVLPAITEPVTLRILPEPDEERFAPHSVVTVVIRNDRAGADADQVILDDVDLSGLTHRDLIQLVPDGRQIRIVGLRTAADTPLPPVAELARNAAREILGVPQVDAADAIELAVVVDTSASMRGPLSDGAAVAACDVVAGIATVIAPGRRLTGSAAALTSRRLAGAPPDRFAAEMAAALGAATADHDRDHDPTPSPRLTTGFRSAAADPDRDGLTVVVTSGVPADRQSDASTPLLILGAPGRSTDWPGAAGATVVDRGGLISSPPDREVITAAVGSLLAAMLPPRST